MPELVEVETTRRDLSKVIENKIINKVSILKDKVVLDNNDIFINKLTNNTIYKVKRRGKWLLFELNDDYLVIHFRMEGRFYLKDKNSIVDKHDYVIFYFDEFNLHYNDPRIFGNMRIIKKDKIDNFFLEKKLGLEYDDENLNEIYLKEKFKNHHTYIKKMLLDQGYITGIGNIYADEILFESKINPKCYADTLSKNKLKLIIENTKLVFERALKCKGTYPNIDGTRGTFEKYLKVHKRLGMPCINCGKLIKKEQIGGRGTYYCPNCQK